MIDLQSSALAAQIGKSRAELPPATCRSVPASPSRSRVENFPWCRSILQRVNMLFYQTNPSHKFVTHCQSIRTANYVSAFLTKTNPNLTLPTRLQPGSVPQRSCSQWFPFARGCCQCQSACRVEAREEGSNQIRPKIKAFRRDQTDIQPDQTKK
jgi:hypothetical protein